MRAAHPHHSRRNHVSARIACFEIDVSLPYATLGRAESVKRARIEVSLAEPKCEIADLDQETPYRGRGASAKVCVGVSDHPPL